MNLTPAELAVVNAALIIYVGDLQREIDKPKRTEDEVKSYREALVNAQMAQVKVSGELRTMAQ